MAKWVLRHVDDQTCEELIALSLREDWSLFDYYRNERYWVLKRYLSRTFERLHYEDQQEKGQAKKILVDEQAGLAVINTGIADPHYDDVYALLSVSDVRDSYAFTIEGFFVDREYDNSPARGTWLRTFCGGSEENRKSCLPPRAHYFELSGACFNANADIATAYEHIISERLFRFPPSYIRKAAQGCDFLDVLLVALERAREADEHGQKSERDCIMNEGVAPLLRKDDGVLYRRIRDDFEDAVQTALRRASYNFNVAVIGYYPTTQRVSFYLPICLEYEEHPDLALVVAPKSGKTTGRRVHRGNTVLRPEEAYVNARLVMPPADNWLGDAAAEFRNDLDVKVLPQRTAVTRRPEDMFSRARLHHDGRYDAIRTGYTVGVKRGSDSRYHPDIALDQSYQFISSKHGEFNCKSGCWTFTSFGRHGTRVVRLGKETFVLEKGIPFELQNDDQLILGGSGGFFFVSDE